MAKPTKGERITGLVSTVVAVVILAAGVTAHQTHSTSRNRLALQEADLRLQVDLALSHNRVALRQRLASIDDVLNAWSHSQQTVQDAQKVSAWLEEAIEATLPGEVRELPAAPIFSVREGTGAKLEASLDGSSRESSHETTPPNSPDRTPATMSTDERAASASGTSEHGPITDVLEAQPESPNPHLQGPTPTLADELTNDAAASSSDAPITASPFAPDVSGTSSKDEQPEAEQINEQDLPPVDAQKSPVPADDGDLLQRSPMQTANVALNLQELQRQIKRHNDAMTTFQVLLANPLASFDEDEIQESVDRLTTLAQQYEFLQIYYGLLSADEQAKIGGPLAPVDAARRLQKQLDALGERQEDDFLGPYDAERQPVLQALDQRLREIAETTSR